ncbi:hypothetical protein [Leucobacter sp. W1478]|uniref:hypothetical protein n=1 Tax=Leucobacter sp. W1478 TaxID=3439065 RepID=UPI003F3B699D
MNAKSPHDNGPLGDLGGSEGKPTTDAPRARRRVRLPIAETSRLANEHATKRRGLIYSAIEAILAEHGPLTDDAIYRAYLAAGYPLRSRQNVGTARCELTDAKRVRYAGARGLSDLGNAARLWEVAPADSDPVQGEGGAL